MAGLRWIYWLWLVFLDSLMLTNGSSLEKCCRLEYTKNYECRDECKKLNLSSVTNGLSRKCQSSQVFHRCVNLAKAAENCCSGGCESKCFFPLMISPIKESLGEYIGRSCPEMTKKQGIEAARCIQNALNDTQIDCTAAKTKGDKFCAEECLQTSRSFRLTYLQKFQKITAACRPDLKKFHFIKGNIIQLFEDDTVPKLVEKNWEVKRYGRVDDVRRICCLESNMTMECRGYCLLQSGRSDWIKTVWMNKDESWLCTKGQNCADEPVMMHQCVWNNPKLLACFDTVASECKPGCHPYTLSFCKVFIDPLGYYQSCSDKADRTARLMYETWKPDIDVEHCRTDDFRRLACYSVFKPCQMEKGGNAGFGHTICRADIEFLVTECGVGPQSVRGKIEALFPKFLIRDHSCLPAISRSQKEESARKSVINVASVFPCSSGVCDVGEVCRINPSCVDVRSRKRHCRKAFYCSKGCSDSSGIAQVKIGEGLLIPTWNPRKVEIEWNEYNCSDSGFLIHNRAVQRSFQARKTDQIQDCDEIQIDTKLLGPAMLVRRTISSESNVDILTDELKQAIHRHILVSACYLSLRKIRMNNILLVNITLTPNGMDYATGICAKELQRIYRLWKYGSIWFASHPVLAKWDSCLTFLGPVEFASAEVATYGPPLSFQMACTVALSIMIVVTVIAILSKKRNWKPGKNWSVFLRALSSADNSLSTTSTSDYSSLSGDSRGSNSRVDGNSLVYEEHLSYPSSRRVPPVPDNSMCTLSDSGDQRSSYFPESSSAGYGSQKEPEYAEIENNYYENAWVALGRNSEDAPFASERDRIRDEILRDYRAKKEHGLLNEDEV